MKTRKVNEAAGIIPAFSSHATGGTGNHQEPFLLAAYGTALTALGPNVRLDLGTCTRTVSPMSLLLVRRRGATGTRDLLSRFCSPFFVILDSIIRPMSSSGTLTKERAERIREVALARQMFSGPLAEEEIQAAEIRAGEAMAACLPLFVYFSLRNEGIPVYRESFDGHFALLSCASDMVEKFHALEAGERAMLIRMMHSAGKNSGFSFIGTCPGHGAGTVREAFRLVKGVEGRLPLYFAEMEGKTDCPGFDVEYWWKVIERLFLFRLLAACRGCLEIKAAGKVEADEMVRMIAGAAFDMEEGNRDAMLPEMPWLSDLPVQIAVVEHLLEGNADIPLPIRRLEKAVETSAALVQYHRRSFRGVFTRRKPHGDDGRQSLEERMISVLEENPMTRRQLGRRVSSELRAQVPAVVDELAACGRIRKGRDGKLYPAATVAPKN